MTSKKFFYASIILMFLQILSSFYAYASRIDANPLFYYESQDDEYVFRALGPVFENSPHESAVRPFYYNDKKTSEVDILYPLGRFTKEQGLFFPVYRHTYKDDQQHVDLFPIFYGEYNNNKYWGLFPIYGTMMNRFGYSRARFILFPLYAETVSDGVTSYSFAWPIFAYGKDRLYRFFPLYGWKSSSDSTYQFFLWPFIHHRIGPDDDRMDAILPLFMYDRSPSYWNLSLLWPFFTYNHDYSNHHISLDFPWPILRIAYGAYEETKIFPFYWSKSEGSTYSGRTILWPLWSDTSWHYKDTLTDEETVTVLLMNQMSRKTMPDGQTSKRLILWPFLYTFREDDKSEWHFPCIFPLFFDEGFTHTWGPVLSLAEGRSYENSSETSILFRIISWERKAETEKFSLSFLASTEKKAGCRQWGFFGNLINFKQGDSKNIPANMEK